MDWDSRSAGRKQETYGLYRALSSLKRNSAALQEGGFKVLYAEGSVFAFARFTEDEAELFLWSVSDREARFAIDAAEFGLPDMRWAVSIDSVAAAVQAGTELKITLAPHQSAVLHIGA